LLQLFDGPLILKFLILSLRLRPVALSANFSRVLMDELRGGYGRESGRR
jgi:hypothetical protein